MPDYVTEYGKDLQVKLMVFISLPLCSLLLLLWCLANLENRDRKFSTYCFIWLWKYLILSTIPSIDQHLAIITELHYYMLWSAARTGGKKVQCLSIMISSAFCWWNNSPNTFWIHPLRLYVLNSLLSFNSYLPFVPLCKFSVWAAGLAFSTLLFCF